MNIRWVHTSLCRDNTFRLFGVDTDVSKFVLLSTKTDVEEVPQDVFTRVIRGDESYIERTLRQLQRIYDDEETNSFCEDVLQILQDGSWQNETSTDSDA